MYYRVFLYWPFQYLSLYVILSLNGSYFEKSIKIKVQDVSFSKYYLLATPSVGMKKFTKRIEFKVRFTF